MEKQKKAYLYALTSVLLWSTVASAFKITLRWVSPVELLFYAACFSCGVLFFALVVLKKSASCYYDRSFRMEEFVNFWAA